MVPEKIQAYRPARRVSRARPRALGGAARPRISALRLAFLAFLALLGGACASAAPGTIGAAMGKRADGRLFVRATPPGEGAANAGIQPDDEILFIDGKDVRVMSQDDVRSAVRGDVGSEVVVTVQRGRSRSDVKVVRTPLRAAPTK